MNGSYYEFREPRSTEELEQLLRLRYCVYKESRLNHFTEDSESGLDIDGYDLNSRHFGLFFVENGHVRPIGYHRIVEDQPGPMKEAIREIALRSGCSEPKSPVELPFPVMEYCGSAAAIGEYCNRAKAVGLHANEATKFSLCKEHHSLALAKHVVESEVAIHMLYRNIEIAITACTPAHSRFYARYGFDKFPGTDDFVHEGVPGRCLMATAASIPAGMRSRLLQMAEAYAKTRKVCFNPNEPENFYGPVRVSNGETSLAA